MNQLPSLLLLVSTLLMTSFTSSAPLNDPTRPAYYQDSVTPSTTEESPELIGENTTEQAQQWALSMTLINHDKKVAIINGKQLHIGQKINNATVVSITHQRVKLEFNKKIIDLYLQASFINQVKTKK